MRLWSIHPKYLDTKGLVVVWREGLLAQSVLLKGEFDKSWKSMKVRTPYYNHPQLNRFKALKTDFPNIFVRKYYPIFKLGEYLVDIYWEAKRRGYNFNFKKVYAKDLIEIPTHKIIVTHGQLEYEFKYLQKKLKVRDKNKYWENHNYHYTKMNPFDKIRKIRPHPLFKVTKGDIEKWEKIK